VLNFNAIVLNFINSAVIIRKENIASHADIFLKKSNLSLWEHQVITGKKRDFFSKTSLVLRLLPLYKL
jgi:hypothetical protein